MRVLVVTAWYPSVATPGTGIFHLRDVELLARDHDVTVLHLGAGADSEEVIDGLRVIRRHLPVTSPATYVRAPRIVRELLKGRDLLHTMSFPTLLPLATLRTPKPWVHTEHWTGLVWPSANLVARLGEKATRRLLRRPDEVVVVGEQLAAAVERIRATPVSRISNFVRLAPTDRLPEAPRPDGRIRLAGVSGLQPHKGTDLAIDAVAELVRGGVDATLSWAGRGPELPDLIRKAEERGVARRVELLGQLEPDEVGRLLTSSHVFVAPTSFETFGVAIAEALAHGLPVVATGDGEHWSFLPPQASRRADRTGAGLAEAVLDLVADPSRWSAEKIRTFAQERFDPELRRTGYLAVYERARQAG